MRKGDAERCKQLARDLAREQLRLARVAVRDALSAKRAARARAKQACKNARALERDADRAYRKALRDEARQRKQAARLPKGGKKLRKYVDVALSVAAERAELDLPAFALRVRELGYHDPRVVRFHDDRAFLASIYDAGAPWKEGLEQWKARAVEAHRAGLLRLTRADLVGAMPPDLVRRSEAAHGMATYHFLALDPPPRGR